MTTGGMRIETVPASDEPVDGVPITVELVLLPPNVSDAGLWVGYDARSPETRYTGWGPAADQMVCQMEDLLPLSGEVSVNEALLVPASVMTAALECLMPVTRAAIVGDGLLAALAGEYLSSRGVKLEPVAAGAELVLAVDTTGEPDRWTSALAALCVEGTLLSLVPPWSKPVAFDFYPQVHHRSLQIIARGWNRPPARVEGSVIDSLRTMISNIGQQGQWMRPLDLAADPVDTDMWRWMHWAKADQFVENLG